MVIDHFYLVKQVKPAVDNQMEQAIRNNNLQARIDRNESRINKLLKRVKHLEDEQGILQKRATNDEEMIGNLHKSISDLTGSSVSALTKALEQVEQIRDIMDSEPNIT